MKMQQLQIMEQEQPAMTIPCKNPYCAQPHEVAQSVIDNGHKYTDSWGDVMVSFRWVCKHCLTEHTERTSA